MFDLEMVKSYILYLREEGGKCLLSSYPDISKADLKRVSLPFLSYCYFYTENSKKYKSLLKLDKLRQESIFGNDIFRTNISSILLSKETLHQESLQVIRRVWPEYFKLIQTIKPRLSRPTKNDLFESASDPKIFGQILYRMDSKCPVKWAEILVHELGHHYLNIVVTTHEDQEIFAQPWDESKHSAIRNEDRPLIGIYHGMFAEACMLELALRILASDKMSSHYRSVALQMVERYGSLFKQDYQTIVDQGCLEFDIHIKEFIESVRSNLESYEFQNPRIRQQGAI